MRITEISINHMVEPIGFALDDLRIEFKVEADQFEFATKQLRIWSTHKDKPDYISEVEIYETNYFNVDIELRPRTRYFVEVVLRVREEVYKKETFFEIGKLNEPYVGEWIANEDKEIQNTLFKKEEVEKARLFI